MMKKATLGVAIASVLTGCGGSSSGGDKSGLTAKSFDLNEYSAISSSSNSLAGTWVAVSEITNSISRTGYTTVHQDTSARKFFIIKETAAGYSSATCTQDGFSNAPKSGNKIGIAELGIMTVKGSASMSGSSHINETNFDETIIGSVSTEIIKISDSTSAIGRFNTTLDNQSDSSEVYCMIENSISISDGTNAGSGTAFLTNAGNINFYSESIYVNDRSNLVIKLDYDEWNTFYDDYIDININNQDNYNLSLSFNASGYDGNLSGHLSIQLPRQ